MRGGRREGAGRKPGSQNKDTKEVRELLHSNKSKLVEKAIKMALAGNVVVLNKLLDKLLPTLNENSNLITFEDWLKTNMQSRGQAEAGENVQFIRENTRKDSEINKFS
jgi:hypothetical protein